MLLTTKMWEEWIKYLDDPVLVVRLQEWFGVKYSKPAPAPPEITNKFWFYLFSTCTALGDEIFYATFIPFWFWNVDCAVGRRFVLVWTVVMCIGQAVKDVVKMPRPGPPVQKLQKKWALEYGMPSTHAMVGLSIPFSILYYTMDRYQYSFEYGLIFSITWCSLICISRIYLGMHSILDIVAGLLLALCIMIPTAPIVNVLDHFLLTNIYSPLLVFLVSVLVIIYFPTCEKWTPTRGDTSMVISFCTGMQIAAWANYQLGYVSSGDLSPPYKVDWPSYAMIQTTICRTIVGFVCVLLTRVISKAFSYKFVCSLLGRDPKELSNTENSLENRDKIIAVLSTKYFTCAMIGFNSMYLFPHIFKFLGIDRHLFYAEI